MTPFEHFITTYLIPLTSFGGLICSGIVAFVALKIDNKFLRFKEELLQLINGKYLHSDVAEAKFNAVEDKLDLLIRLDDVDIRARDHRR